jgi:hypothetical protein
MDARHRAEDAFGGTVDAVNTMRDNGLAAAFRAVHWSRLDSLNMLLRHPFATATRRSPSIPRTGVIRIDPDG